MKKTLFFLVIASLTCLVNATEFDDIKIRISNKIENSINNLDKSKVNVLDKPELIALINELKIKSCILNERVKKRRGEENEYLSCNEIDSIKESPYSVSSTIELLNYSYQAWSVCMVGNDDDLFTDIKYINFKIINHVKDLGIVHDAFTSKLLSESNLAKK